MRATGSVLAAVGLLAGTADTVTVECPLGRSAYFRHYTKPSDGVLKARARRRAQRKARRITRRFAK